MGSVPCWSPRANVEHFTAFILPAQPPLTDLARERVADQPRPVRRRRAAGPPGRHLPAMEPIAFELALELEADFADIITVKEHASWRHRPAACGRCRRRAAPPRSRRAGARPLRRGGAQGARRRKSPSRRRPRSTAIGSAGGSSSRPGERWELRIEVVATPGRRSPSGRPAFRARLRRGAPARPRVARGLARAACPRLRAPGSRSSGPTSGRSPTWRRSGCRDRGRVRPASRRGDAVVHDGLRARLDHRLAADARPRTELGGLGARAARRAPGDRGRSAIDAEPGKIIHELRRGKAAPVWFPRYYGTVDATPLYLILLSELWRWTDDAALVARFKEPALAALGWIDDTGTATATASSSTSGERLAVSPTSRGRTRTTHSASRTGGSRARRSLRARSRATCSTRSGALPRSHATPGTIASLADRLDREAYALRDRFDAGLLGRPARRVLRARARRREAAGRLALLQHRASPLERHRPGALERARLSTLYGRGALVGLGRADDVVGRRRLQPARATTTEPSGRTTVP